MESGREQLQRYDRNMALQNVGAEGQEKLLQSSVLIIGIGGLGSPAALYLAAAGVGTIGLVDADIVEISNLQRQIIHHTRDIGRIKVESGEDAIKALNPDVCVKTHPVRFNPDNALDILSGYDFVIDGTDNLESKFLIADACHLAQKPYSHAGILEFYGQTITVLPGKTTCYRCIFRNTPPDCPGNCKGVMGVLPGVMGTIQATEALKYILGIGQLLTNRMLSYDALDMTFRTVDINRNENCPLCGQHPEITDLGKYPSGSSS